MAGASPRARSPALRPPPPLSSALAAVSRAATFPAFLKEPRPFDSSARSSLRRLLLRALQLEAVFADDVSRAEDLFTGQAALPRLSLDHNIVHRDDALKSP